MKSNQITTMFGVTIVTLSFMLMVGAGGCGGSSVGGADKALKRGDNKKAIELLQAGIKEDDAKNPQAYFLLGKAYYASGQVEDAFKSYNKAKELGLTGKDLIELNKLINALWGIELTNAINSYNGAINLIREGKKDVAKLKLDSSKTSARNAVIIQPDSTFAYTVLTNALILKEEYTEAATTLENAVAKNKKNAQLYIQLSNIYSQYLNKDTVAKKRAVEVLEDAKKFAGETPEIVKQLTIAYVVNGRSKEAVELAKKIVEGKPTEKLSHYLYAITLGEVGRYDESLDAYNKALAIDSTFEEANYNFAFIALKKGEKDFTENSPKFNEEQKQLVKAKKIKKGKEAKYEGHLVYINNAIAKILRIVGKNKPDYLDLLATLYAKKGDNVNAELSMKKADEIRKGAIVPAAPVAPTPVK